MGRHGGGSRSGGSSSRSSSSRSSGGSRRSGSSSGGSLYRNSSTPFKGCYNRTYYDRKGIKHTYYTNDRLFGTERRVSFGSIFALCFVTIHMIFMMGSIIVTSSSFGGKVDGDENRIQIIDTVDTLSDSEEEGLTKLLKKVYDKSGMPITVYTDSFWWKDVYDNLAVYSEELYYTWSYDETSMIILFTEDNSKGFYDWEYDMYCGDLTVKCLSDDTFDKLIDNFQKGMSSQSLYEALDYSLNSVIDEMAEFRFDWSCLIILLFVGLFYSIFYLSILIPLNVSTKKTNDAYRYFKQNPEKLVMSPMVLYSECPNCGASNSYQEEKCPYCDTLLKIEDGNVRFVKPN